MSEGERERRKVSGTFEDDRNENAKVEKNGKEGSGGNTGKPKRSEIIMTQGQLS